MRQLFRILLFTIIVNYQLSIVNCRAQTLNVKVGSVTYQFPASQTGEMTYADGETVTIMGKTFALADINSMTVDETSVADGTIGVSYNGTSATVTVAGNVAQYVTPTVSGAHVSIAQSDDLAEEITYTLSGTSSDGEFYMSGSYKATIEFNGLTLTNATPVYSGAAVHIQNGKRIKVKIVTGTTNTLSDASTGSQKGCLYIKGHAEFAQKGTLNVVGNVKHGIKTGEYMTLKNATINVTSAVGDGISCAEYFLMESGTINITVTAAAAKGIKADGDMRISDGDITVKTTGGGAWDSDEKKTKAASCLSADGNTVISGGTLSLTSTGAGGKGINGDGTFTATGGTMTIKTSGNAVVASSSGTLSTISSSQQLDRYDSDYKSSPKGIKIDGAILISDQAVISITTTGAGGEGIESKTSINITGGQVTVNAADDAINASYNDATKGTSGAGDLTISGGYVYARSTGNDGIDANGNVYIKGGLVYAIGTSSPEVGIDANSEEQKKLYLTGGTIIAIGGLENGSSLTQSCYSTSSWSKSTWYALGASQPTLKKSVTVSSGTKIFDGAGYTNATITGGSNVSLSSYTGGGGGPGGGGRPW